MSLRTTHTYALLEVSAATHAEIRGKLEAADYGHAFDGEVIDMHGIALTPAAADPISEAFAALAATESAHAAVSEIKAAAPVREPLYVLISDGLYWRPGKAGYTSDLLHAGLFTDADSAPYLGAAYADKRITRELATDALAKLAERKRKGFDTVDERMLELFEEAMGRATSADVKRLEGFKSYVHKRLDDAHVPSDPDPEATAQHGCRIEGRLAWVFSRELNGALLNELEEYHDHTIDQGDHDCEGIPGDCPVARLLARARGAR